MASQVKSTAVTAYDATPRKMSDFILNDDKPVGVCEVAAADVNGSRYDFFIIKSNDRVHHLWLLNDAIQSGTSFDIGLYDTAENGGAVVAAAAFASAVDMTSARVAPTDVATEAANIDKSEKRVWELLGLSSDPHKEYVVAATGNIVGSGAGTLVLKGELALG